MKHLKTLVIAVVIAVGSMSFANAQTKVAHIFVDQIISEMPEMKAAEAEIKKLGQSYESDIRSTYQELQNKAQLYENEAASKTDEENAKRAQEIQGMQANIQQAQQVAAQEIEKKKMELLQPILQKVNDAIKKVGEAKGFDYVMDASAGSGIILANGTDITADVRTELGF